MSETLDGEVYILWRNAWKAVGAAVFFGVLIGIPVGGAILQRHVEPQESVRIITVTVTNTVERVIPCGVEVGK